MNLSSSDYAELVSQLLIEAIELND